AITAGAPALLVVALTGLPILVACTITALAFAASAAWELRRRWHDALDAALVLDRVLDAKDRFSSALQFARTEDPPSLHRLQIKEAGAFLDGIASIPKPPRPAYRAGRYATAAIVALGLTVPVAYLGPELAAWVRGEEDPSEREEPRTAEEIAAAAESVRARPESDPDRRLDAEINALEHELAEQRRRAQDNRATAIREAAELLERAAGIEPESEQGTSEETAESTEPAPVPRSVDADPPEWASRQLAESWERAREAMREWRESASDPASDPHRTAQLQQEAQRRQMEALSLARQERSWQTSRSEEERAQEQRLREQRRSDSETTADRLDRSVELLDRALERLHRSDDSPGLPPPEV